MDYTFLLGSIENLLGKSHKKARGNFAFHCPFCNHRKPKLEINMATNENGKNPWECWVCETKGTTIRSLLYQLKTPKDQSNDIVFFENLINWNAPIVICEGVFDAMAIRRNAIPLLGKNMAPALYKKILLSSSTDVYVALDSDARNRALQISEKLLNQGKRVYLVEMKEKDPSEMGFASFTEHIQSARELDLSSLMVHKLDL